MPYALHKHHHRSIRRKGFDYANSGCYFITICIQNGECVLGKGVEGEMILNDWGKIVADTLLWLEKQYDHVLLDEWVIMPNHIHVILILHDGDRRGVSEPPIQ